MRIAGAGPARARRRAEALRCTGPDHEKTRGGGVGTADHVCVAGLKPCPTCVSCAVAGLKPCPTCIPASRSRVEHVGQGFSPADVSSSDASRVDDRVSQARISEPFQIVANMWGRASALQTYRRPTRVVSTTGVAGEHFCAVPNRLEHVGQGFSPADVLSSDDSGVDRVSPARISPAVRAPGGRVRQCLPPPRVLDRLRGRSSRLPVARLRRSRDGCGGR
jgi:hypothetical protein